MRNVWVVFKKEVFRVFSDPRLILTVFIVPGLSIFLIYTLMGNVIGSQVTSIEEHRSRLYVENMPETVEPFIDSTMQYRLHNEPLSRAELETKLQEGKLDLAVLFDAEFDAKVSGYDIEGDLPTLHVMYNQGEQRSSRAHSLFLTAMNRYHEAVVIERLNEPEDYHVFALEQDNFVDDRQLAAQGFAMLLPMLIVIFLFAGAMSIGPDAIAGEKERGTIATLLVTPIRRRDIALGKVASLSVLALLSALSSFIGIILSLPSLLQMDDTLPDVAIYGIQEYAVILVLLMVTVLFIVALIATLSAYAKTIKEASMLIMPFYFIAMIIGVMNSFGSEVSTSPVLHMIPIYGPINLLSGILMFEYSMMNFVVTIVASLVYTGLLVVVLNFMFNSEKIMFQK